MKHYLTVPLIVLGAAALSLFIMQTWLPGAVMVLRFGLSF